MRVPAGIAAIMRALRFEGAEREPLARLNARDWDEVLAFTDRTQLTLVLGAAAGQLLPEPVRERIARDLGRNTERLQRARTALFAIQDWLDAARIPFVVLKGFTQWPAFIADVHVRPQYDIDLYCPRPAAQRARDVLAAHGYEPLGEFEAFPTDHLPVMVQKTGWQWRGDFFDPEIPFAVELHFRFWDQATERLHAPGLDAFWNRRTGRLVDRRELPVLEPADTLGYAGLHLVRHLLRGSLRPYHVYELAWFLHSHARDDKFWYGWRAQHAAELRRLEAVAFRLAEAWFGCRMAGVVREETERLPRGARRWFERYALSPLEAFFHPNKDELWLHLSLLDSPGDRLRVVRRRLLPARLPGPVDAVHVPRAHMTWRMHVRKQVRYTAHLGARGWFHLRVLPRILWRGAAWWMEGRGLPAPYWRFLEAASLFNLGMFVFTLLYNLLLLERGFREDVVGRIAGTATAGSIAGTLPAAALARRFGWRRLLPACFVLMAGVAALRAVLSGEAALLVLAFAAGAGFATWAVAIAPTIAQLTEDEPRPLGFSIFFAVSIALGVAGGWLSGKLAGWFGGYAQAITMGCFLMAAAAWPAARLPLKPVGHEAARIFPRGAFVARYLAAFSVWHVATGAFNPFFNTYFARRFAMTAERIGLAFSGAQLTQVAALLAAPFLLRRLGLANGIAGMAAATALALACLAGVTAAPAAAAAYAAYMGFQFMSEPGLNTLLMRGVAPAERGGAAALAFLVAFGAQAVAAFGAGAAFTRFGYPPVLYGAACAAACAALLFRRLLRWPKSSRGGNGPR